MSRHYIPRNDAGCPSGQLADVCLLFTHEQRRRRISRTVSEPTSCRYWFCAVPAPVSHYRIALFPQKSLPGRQFTGKNPPRPAAARAGRIFAGKLSAGETFLGERRRSYNVDTFLWDRRYFNTERHTKSVIISPRADFSRGGILMWHRHWLSVRQTECESAAAAAAARSSLVVSAFCALHSRSLRCTALIVCLCSSAPRRHCR